MISNKVTISILYIFNYFLKNEINISTNKITYNLKKTLNIHFFVSINIRGKKTLFTYFAMFT